MSLVFDSLKWNSVYCSAVLGFSFKIFCIISETRVPDMAASYGDIERSEINYYLNELLY